MRLFIAILLDETAKDKLAKAQQTLRGKSSKGNFSNRENFHLTLAFLGETEPHRVLDFEAAISACAAKHKPFDMELKGVGCFRRPGGDILWAGISPCEPLQLIYRDLCASLEDVGFVPDRPSYSPHVTLGRGVKTKDGFDVVGLSDLAIQSGIPISKISLMKSWQVDGRLTYTPIFEAPLGKEVQR